MDCLFLAAGYATRLYPLTEHAPKPLLEVKGKSILDWLVDDIDRSGRVNRLIVVSNHKYMENFLEWEKKKKTRAELVVLDDGTISNETRLGAVADIALAIDHLSLKDDLLVAAGDNVLDFSLGCLLDYFEQKKAPCVMRYYEENRAVLQKGGVMEVDGCDCAVSMEEKPECPKANWMIPPFYCYPKEALPLISQGIAAGCKTDAPGGFLAWLCGQRAVYAMEMPGKRYDIGDLESYRLVQEQYPGILY